MDSGHHHHHHHLSLNREGRWGTKDDLATSFLHFSPFFTAVWDLAKSRLVYFLILSSHLFLCLPSLSSSPFHCALQDGFGQTWWTGDMTIPLQFASLTRQIRLDVFWCTFADSESYQPQSSWNQTGIIVHSTGQHKVTSVEDETEMTAGVLEKKKKI